MNFIRLPDETPLVFDPDQVFAEQAFSDRSPPASGSEANLTKAK
jgi:hypothetical protein